MVTMMAPARSHPCRLRLPLVRADEEEMDAQRRLGLLTVKVYIKRLEWVDIEAADIHAGGEGRVGGVGCTGSATAGAGHVRRR